MSAGTVLFVVAGFVAAVGVIVVVVGVETLVLVAPQLVVVVAVFAPAENSAD